MTCLEEEAYVDILRTTDLLSRGSTLESKIKSLKIDKNRFKTDPEGWRLLHVRQGIKWPK